VHAPIMNEPFIRIKVVGVGGAGGYVVQSLYHSGIPYVDYIAANTDMQALSAIDGPRLLCLGETTTEGRGAGSNPLLGQRAAEESETRLQEYLRGADMVLIVAGMGGGTGSGAVPVIASIARDMGALTVAAITRPFRMEGARRAKVADQWIAQLRPIADTVVIISNDQLLRRAERSTTLIQGFETAAQTLSQGVQGLAEIISNRGLINVDFADIRTIMADAGPALLGIGQGYGPGRAVEAMQQAMSSPLIENRIEGARSVLFNISGGEDLGVLEAYQAADMLHNKIHEDANIIVGATIGPNHYPNAVKITLIATGFEREPTPSTVHPHLSRIERDFVKPPVRDPDNQPVVAHTAQPPRPDPLELPPFLKIDRTRRTNV
jgi:cell division protein FtsZ